jgi:pimeloyl-ACP methyl ester carboxylesterase
LRRLAVFTAGICLAASVVLPIGCEGSATSPEPTTTPQATAVPTPGVVSQVAGVIYRDEDGDGAYDEDTDTAIEGATVAAYLEDREVASAKADENGKYVLSAPTGPSYVLKVFLPAEVDCYDPDQGEWDRWSTVEGRVAGVELPADTVDIGVSYRMLNYGPDDFLWELWHAGPLAGGHNVVLVHGGQLSVVRWVLEAGEGKQRGAHDDEFFQLDDLLQSRQHGRFDVWEFEYADVESYGRYWTHGSIVDYGERLGTALDLVRGLTGSGVSLVAHSMGGLVSRYAAQYRGGVEQVLTLSTAHFGFEYTTLVELLTSFPCIEEVTPGSDFLWDLNADFRHGDFEMMSVAASMDAPAVSPIASLVRYSSASLVECDDNGEVVYDPEGTYFTAIPGTHGGIKHIDLRPDDPNKDDDFSFQGIEVFLRNGICDELRSWSEFVYPGDLDSRPYVSFRFTNPTPQGYPEVLVNGRLVRVYDMHTAHGERLTWTFSARADEEGVVEIRYADGESARASLTRGQSALIKRVISN